MASPILIDFFNIHKWFPGLSISYGIHGNNREVVVSDMALASQSHPSTEPYISWSIEKLTAVDPAEKMDMYEIVDSNIGFDAYVSTVKICPASGDKGSIMWRYVSVDPIKMKGWRMEELVGNYEAVLKTMAKKMADNIL